MTKVIQETAVRDCVKETITNSIFKKEKGVVRAVVIPGITGLGNKARAVKYVCEDEKVKNGFDVVTWIHGVDLQEHFAEFVEFLRGSIFKVFEDENGQISNTGRSLAAVVVGNDNVYVKDKGIIDKDVRRLSLSSDLDVSKGIPRSLSETNKNKQYPQQEWLKNFTSLARLEIRDCKALKSIKGWKHLTSLNRLLISHCTDIDLPSEEWQGLKALGRLIIEDISDLESLPEGIQFLTSLDTLEIKGCPKLKTVPEAISDALYFTYFVIDDCPKLVTLPESLVEFAVLNIRNSPLLESWNQSRPKFATQDTQEEKNSTAPNINRSSSKHEIQNVYQGTDSFVGCPRCIHCTNSLRIIPLLERWNQSRPKFATQDTQEEQNSTAPNINRSSSEHEIQNVYHGTDTFVGCPHCIHCTNSLRIIP
ncbi:Disease resistance protein RGA2 [Spatholobus suberectus]|nr:Disease resistance protein RGA2 [Spatholobus suberectus]